MSSKGKGPLHHRKVLRDSIWRVTKPAIQRLVWRAGGRVVSSLLYEESREIIKLWLENWIRDISEIAVHLRKQTITEENVIAALNINGINFAAGLTGKLDRSPTKGVKGGIGGGVYVAKGKEGDIKRAHRFLAGTVALRQVRKAQKKSDSFAIAYRAFDNLVREIAQNYRYRDNDFRFSPKAISALQLTLETKLVELYANAQLASLHSKRIGIHPSDIQLIRQMREKTGASASGVLVPIGTIYSGRRTNFFIYIKKVLRQVHPDQGIKHRALITINNIGISLVGRVVMVANILLRLSGKQTISIREVLSAVRIVFPGEIAKQALSQGIKVVTKFMSSKEEYEGGPIKKGGSKQRRSARAGLLFPPSRVSRIMSLYAQYTRKSAIASVYLAGVIEYIIAELLELAGHKIMDAKRHLIDSRSLLLAVAGDTELNGLLRDYVIGGGVQPYIHKKVLEFQESKKKKED